MGILTEKSTATCSSGNKLHITTYFRNHLFYKVKDFIINKAIVRILFNSVIPTLYF